MRLIAEYAKRGDFVAVAHNSPNNAARLLSGEKDYPSHLTAKHVHALLRDAERSELVAREKYRDDNRKSRERWTLTDAGRAFADVDAAEF